jgi:hypothetical protein
MRRKAQNRLLAVLFTLLLGGAVSVSRATIVLADVNPINDPRPGGTGWQTRRSEPVQSPGFGVKIMQLRMAFLAGLRFFFRFI